MNLVECNVLVGDSKLLDLGVKQEGEWARGSFILESVVGHISTPVNDDPAITICLLGGHSMTIKLSNDEFIELYKAGMNFDEEEE